MIEPLRTDQIEAAKAVISEVCREFFGRSPLDYEDMDDVGAFYAEPNGCFLVLVDGGRVVGTGAVRRIDGQTCELKRMWFLPSYRGIGYGTEMAQRLLAFARHAGYERIRLDTSPVLEAAIRLYRRLGFRPIERYNDGPCGVFLMKEL